MPQESKLWTKPTIYPKGATARDMDKEWRVWFRYFHEGKRIIVSRKYDLNAITDYRERLQSANAVVRALTDKLKKGWNPITDTFPAKTSKDLELERLQTLTFSDALDFAYEKKRPDWKTKSASDYASVVKYLKKAARAVELHDTPVADMKRPHFLTILGATNLSPYGYNKYRSYLSALVAVLKEWEVVDTNRIRDISTKKVNKTVAHRPPTQDQRLQIIERIKTHHRYYYRFLSILYGCTIRPVEITRLKIKYLNRVEGIFRLPAGITKNGQEADVPVPRWVMDLLSELPLHKLDPEWYLFSMDRGAFLPGPKQMSVNNPGNYWRRIVKADPKKGGLGLDVNLYSLKKLSGDDMVRLQQREGVHNLLELPRQMMRHSEQGQTEVYVQEHREVFKALIRDKMPEL